ncbi:MAG TPA: tRNA glutamyl-Q(34) synthetase GluQRS [Microthrixaceae bacterium]|nr:tRNA glutamyl-Q(34) synthetase GluQRS [Microthrixaceae bacterium]
MTVGRFAPSPSGSLHLGSLRTALLAWCAARHERGRFLVRMEDLTTGAAPVREREQLEDLAMLGLHHDGPVVRQSERTHLYDAAIDRLTASGLTYPCYCSRREIREAAAAPHGPPTGTYPGTCRDLTDAARRARERDGRRPALRLRAGGEVVGFVDRLVGEHEAEVDDFVLRRADGVAAYNLAVVVDDADQGVDQVVRGDDLVPTTPRQVLLQRLLGLPTPEYLHVPLVLGPDGERLAKRHGAVGLGDRLAAGDTPEGVIGMLAASLDLAEPGERLTADEVLERFDPDRIPTRPWVLDPSDLPAG